MENQNREPIQEEVIDQKSRDAETPGHAVAFDPDEADRLAFHEDALSDEDARESAVDLQEQGKGKDRMDTTDFAKRLADRLIEQLKEGTAPWQQPWAAGQAFGPYNPTTGNRYRGVNILALMSSDFADPRWMTYKQAQGQGWQVRGGEKATQIQHWIWEEARPRLGKDGQPELDAEGKAIKDLVRLARLRRQGAITRWRCTSSGIVPTSA